MTHLHLVLFGKKNLPETNSEFAPGNGWLEYNFPFGMAYFQGRTVSFRECNAFEKVKIIKLWRFTSLIFGEGHRLHIEMAEPHRGNRLNEEHGFLQVTLLPIIMFFS